jgi:exci/endonuclease
MGINDSFTKRYHVYYLVYYETISNIKDAIHREKSIKGFSRNKKEVLINSINPEWKDLSKEWL